MKQLLEDFKNIILQTVVLKYEISGNNIKLRMKIVFTDQSCLFVYETIISGKKRKYSYHWQNRDGEMIKRWDNAPDWDNETFPHHVHIGENVYPSYTRSLDQILPIIKEALS